MDIIREMLKPINMGDLVGDFICNIVKPGCIPEEWDEYEEEDDMDLWDL